MYEQLSELPEYQQADEQEEELDEELEPESLDENISLNEDSKEKLEQDKAQIAQKFTDMPIPYLPCQMERNLISTTIKTQIILWLRRQWIMVKRRTFISILIIMS